MEYLSFFGIILGLGLFISMCFKRYNMLLTAVASASVMIIFSCGPAELFTTGFTSSASRGHIWAASRDFSRDT